jgi:mannose-6-phosphate isomerase-like protein (cupin superfamily)
MIIKNLVACDEFIAGDSTILREILHPDKAPLSLRYSLAHAVLKPGTKSYPHSLTTSEVYYILGGSGRMHINDEIELVRIGDTVYIPPDARQYIENIGSTDLKFLCIVDPAWRKEDEHVYE